MLQYFTAIVDLGKGLLRVWVRLPNRFHMFRMQRLLWELCFDVLSLSHTFLIVTGRTNL